MKRKQASMILAVGFLFYHTAIAQLPKVARLSAEKETEETTFDQRTKITPGQEQYTNFASSFKMEFKPYSLTVLRIKKTTLVFKAKKFVNAVLLRHN
jgi:alpha-L-arabinofuranosidase